jgi:hypothetical protein
MSWEPAFIKKTLAAMESNRLYRWLSLGLTLKGFVALGTGVVTFFIGIWRDINPFYAVVGALFVVASVLTIMNQHTMRRGFKTTASGGVDLGPPDGTHRHDRGRYVPHKQRATVEELTAGRIVNRLVYVTDLPPDNDGMIRQKTFIDCEMVGPAIISPGRSDLVHPTLGAAEGDIESVLWPANPAARLAVGVFGFDLCQFEDCRFEDIGITGPPDLLDQYRQIPRNPSS